MRNSRGFHAILYHCGFALRPYFMKTTFLDFEHPIAELEAKIEELRFAQDNSAVDISAEILRLQKKSFSLTNSIYGKLTPWQISQVARHPQRPYTLDYIQHLFTDFEELHGDRGFADDHAIIAGLARFGGQPVMVCAQDVRPHIRKLLADRIPSLGVIGMSELPPDFRVNVRAVISVPLEGRASPEMY